MNRTQQAFNNPILNETSVWKKKDELKAYTKNKKKFIEEIPIET